MSKLKVHNTVKTIDTRTKQQKAMANAERELPDAIEGLKILAKMYKAKYDSLIDVGFTEEQAIELLGARGIDN